MNEKFDLTVIGGGPGGYVAAIRACQLGLKVAVIEERQMGGTCLNRGCIPTKSLLHSAKIFHLAKSSSEFGVEIENVRFNYKKIVSRKDSVVKQLRSGVESLVKSNGAVMYNGKAMIKDRNTIEITGADTRVIHTDKIIVATGSKPAKPPIPGIEGELVLDSDAVLELTECPDRVVIIGGGVIGVEFATVFNALGREVTIVEMMDAIVPGIDVEISSALRKSLEKRGVKIFTGAKVTSIESDHKAACNFETNGSVQRTEVDRVIVAIGRKPNTNGIGLENIGVDLEKGFIQVNDRLETSVKDIYAIGDVTGKIQLAHVASAQGLVAAANAAGQSHTMNYSIVPSCIYTSPEIAAVGLTESEALNKGYKVKIGRFPVSINGKSMIMGEKEGLIKIITDEITGEILGTQIMGPRATDMIAEICVAMKLEATIEEVAATIHPHPTVSEIIMEAAHDVEGLCVHKLKR
ncbi:MAG: dihydrolipoyl dehydrogenase [Desulfitobacteriaceae bacterium]